MVREKVYLETSVISYLTARPSRDTIKLAKQELTLRWWEKYRLTYDFYVSTPVIEEISLGDPEAARRRREVIAGLSILTTTDVIDAFHEHLFAARILPEKARADTLHIALSAAYGMTYLATWNCVHINNATLREKILDEIRRVGYTEVTMATPEELWRLAQ